MSFQQTTSLRVLWILFFAIAAGCNVVPRESLWKLPVLAEPHEPSPSLPIDSLLAEDFYAEAVKLESLGAAECVDLYYQAASHAWNRIEGNVKGAGPPDARQWHVYHSAVTKLITTAERCGRLDRLNGLQVTTADGPIHIPIEYHGFAWEPEDFRVLTPVGKYPSDSTTRVHRRDGLGVSLLARSSPRQLPFRRPEQVFAATAVLLPNAALSGKPGQRYFTLAFYNPLNTFSIYIDGCEAPISQDITAPIAYLLDRNGRDWLTNFLQPNNSRQDQGLFMFEPYQRGKIPIVFVHGLLSDPSTWADLGNELRAHPEILERYQFWTFSYDTGAPFMEGAHTLRKQLHEIRDQVDPSRTDAALSQMILIGHSMGGLVSKLQVTSSHDILWKSVSKQPLQAINTSPEVRKRLEDEFFFEPSPDIARVVFVGTPHQGSGWARRAIGRLGSALVKVSAEDKLQHQQLVAANPGVFSEEVQNRIPTSVDLLENDSYLLQAISRLPFRSGVQAHSIIGTGYWTPNDGPSDQIVPVSSASLAGVSSELFVDSQHTKIHHKPETVNEVMRILNEHLNQCGLTSPPETLVLSPVLEQTQ